MVLFEIFLFRILVSSTINYQVDKWILNRARVYLYTMWWHCSGHCFFYIFKCFCETKKMNLSVNGERFYERQTTSDHLQAVSTFTNKHSYTHIHTRTRTLCLSFDGRHNYFGTFELLIIFGAGSLHSKKLIEMWWKLLFRTSASFIFFDTMYGAHRFSETPIGQNNGTKLVLHVTAWLFSRN